MFKDKWNILALVLLSLTLLVIFFVAPPEASQGYVQKIFYIHIGSALSMYVGFVSGALAALVYLFTRNDKADALAVAGVEVGVVFCTIVLCTGPIWARPIWGVWWTWDARLTSTFFCWLIFVSAILVRGALNDSAKARSVSAAVAVFGLFDIPIIIFAVRLWRGVHPSVLGKENSMPWSMRGTLILSMITLIYLAVILVRARYKEERLRRKINETHYA